ncbi:MAG: methyltransferase domain-containing protein [Candidatus Bathyarchaeia archaeon]
MSDQNMNGQHTRKVLNVGGYNKNIVLPPQYKGWQQVLLDIDPMGNPDVLCDARELMSLSTNEYDAVYCSHNLEHYYRHDVPKVLRGFIHVLKEDGFADISVPDLDAVMKTVVQKEMDIDDILYQLPIGPILVRDVIYGYGVEIEQSGKDFFAHKTGFTPKSLKKILNECGFSHIFTGVVGFQVRAIAFKDEPTDYAVSLFSLSKE